MVMSIRDAFAQLAESPVLAGRFYVVLWRDIPFYGGPEEGGWWGTDSVPEAFQECPSLEAATALAERMWDLADKLTEEASNEHGRGCLSRLAWCEERGIDDSNSVFGEDDGPERWRITVQEGIPVATEGDRHYS